MKYISKIILLFVSLISISCVSELFPEHKNPTDGKNIRISFECESPEHYQIGTKSEIEKTEKETEIKHLFIFFFDDNGLININTSNATSVYPGSTKDYICLEGPTILMLNDSYFSRSVNFNDVDVYAFANFEKTALNNFLAGKEINKQTLLGYNYCPSKEPNRPLTDLPEEGMPMFGYEDGKDLTADNATITLGALMARIDMSVSMIVEGDDENKSDRPNLDIQSIIVYNTANGVNVGGNDVTDFSSTGIPKNDDENNKRDITRQVPINPAGSSYTETFYIFENKQSPKIADIKTLFGLGNSTADQDKLAKLMERPERFKKDIAKEDVATYIQFTGRYTDVTGVQSIAQLTFYLGGKEYNNFEVKRNCHYKNTITITGLASDDTNHNMNHVLYDSRVHVDATETTPYFLSIIKAQEIDAHIGVIPIDFYIYNNIPTSDNGVIIGQELTVTIDANTSNWIKLEKVSANDMENGELTGTYKDQQINTGNGLAWQAGHGKRKYFLNDLVTNSARGLVSSCKITDSRDRIYLYVDQNLSTKDRTGKIQISCKIHKQYENGGTAWIEPAPEDIQTIEITQLGLLEVAYINEDKSGKPTEYIYIEQIEEYLDNYDPYDNYNTNMVYAGLPWSTVGDFSIGYKVYYTGSEATSTIIDETEDYVMHLHEKPSTAAEYCYNKNRRNENGRILQSKNNRGAWVDGVEEYGWFLPGIRQMEKSITAYFGAFPSFQTEFYWSSSGAAKGLLIIREDYSRARATKFSHTTVEDGVITAHYVESGENHRYEDNNGGNAKRTVSFRIRAAYWNGGARLTN